MYRQYTSDVPSKPADLWELWLTSVSSYCDARDYKYKPPSPPVRSRAPPVGKYLFYAV